MRSKDRMINRLAYINPVYVDPVEDIDVGVVAPGFDMQTCCLLIPQLTTHMRKEVIHFILAYLTFIQLVTDFIGKCQNGIDIRDMFALLAKRIKSVQKIGFKLLNSHYVHPLDMTSTGLLPSFA